MATRTGPLNVTREQVLAYRLVAHGLDRKTKTPERLRMMDLGVQETPLSSASLALAARLPVGVSDDLPAAWVQVWGARGAPYFHRRADVHGLAAALWPADADDASARLGALGSSLKKQRLDPLDAYATTTRALRELVKKPMVKGDLSTAITKRIPDEYTSRCRSCGTTHINEQLLRVASLAAGLAIERDTSPAVLAPIKGWRSPTRSSGVSALIDTYLRVHGPASAPDVAAYFQASSAGVRAAWPDSAVDVEIAGGKRPKKASIAADAVDALRKASPADGVVRLLPRSDPWLTARDRDVIVPDRARQKALWPILGAPGAVLVDGEIVGVWRVKTTPKRVDITVKPFARLPRETKAAIAAEAEVVAGTRGVDDSRVSYDAG